ncbi:nucleotidyltransferase domain-containing protein [Tomitella biformata]
MFGSVVRGDAGATSDIDAMVTIEARPQRLAGGQPGHADPGRTMSGA